MAIIDIPNDAFANLEYFNYHDYFGGGPSLTR